MKLQWTAAIALCACLVAVGCSKNKESIVKTADGVHLSAADIDRDPTALLPSGVIGLASLDGPQLFASQFGQQLLGLLRSRAPIPPGAGFDPQRDLERVIVGFYSMQGADAVAVATGNFKPDAIEAAADGTTHTALGAPLVKQTYAGRTMYLSRNIGFVVMTSRTVILGNETAIRRVLDRIEEGRVTRAIPTWWDEFSRGQTAPLFAAADFTTNPLIAPNTDEMPFMKGVQTVKLVGTFQPPGVHVTGSMTYASADAAVAGAASLKELHSTISRWGFLASLVGLAQPIRTLDVQPRGSDVAVAATVEGQGVATLLEYLAKKAAEGAPPPAPPPAPSAPPPAPVVPPQ